MIFGIWPTCAKEGCGALAFVQFKFVEDGREFMAWLCVDCIKDVGRLFSAVSVVKQEERDLLAGSSGQEIIPREEGPQALTG